MGNPLSAVMASLFMEVLEEGPIKETIGNHVTWLRYVDDILVILPRRTDINTLLNRLNTIHNNIKFTIEEENTENSLPFLDTIIHRYDNSVKFSVYRKPTNKNDFIHYFSGHDHGTKTGIVIGFFLRAIRICDQEFLDEEIQYITKTFSELCYPVGLIKKCLKKAYNIIGSSKEKETKQNIIVPPSSLVQSIRAQTKKQFTITTACGEKIKDIVSGAKKNTVTNQSVVYEIPCADCQKSYIGETYRGIAKRIEEHKGDIRRGSESNALFVHREQTNHTPDFTNARVLKTCKNRTTRKIEESILISTGNRINIRESSHRISPILAKLLS